MLGERDAVVAEVRRYEVHGSPHVQVALAFADRTFAAGAARRRERAGGSAPGDAGAGPPGDERRRRRSSARRPDRRPALLVGRAPLGGRPRRSRGPGGGPRATLPASRRPGARTTRGRGSGTGRHPRRPACRGRVRSAIRRRVIAGVASVVKRTALVAAGRAPADLAAESPLGLVRDPHALAPGVLAEALDARRRRGLLRLGAGVRGQLGLASVAHDEDLVPVELHARRGREPVVREPAREPADAGAPGNRWVQS